MSFDRKPLIWLAIALVADLAVACPAHAADPQSGDQQPSQNTAPSDGRAFELQQATDPAFRPSPPNQPANRSTLRNVQADTNKFVYGSRETAEGLSQSLRTTQRLETRLMTRIDSRLQTRIDQNYQAPMSTTQAFERAEAEAKHSGQQPQ